MRRNILILCALAALTAGTAPVMADKAKDKNAAKPEKEQKTLTIGDKAAAIDIEHWVMGDKVKRLEKGEVYVIEFWATWCGPCRASMPHISKLQDEYGDKATVISVSDEELDVVTDFLGKADKENVTWREKVHYRLTTDPDESVKKDYFKAAGQRGIPTAFIVGRSGLIEWIGHPMSMDEPLAAVVNDTWDREEYAEKWERQQKLSGVQRELSMAQRQGEWEKAWELVEKMEKIDPENPYIQSQKFTILLVGLDEPKKAYKLGEKILKDNWDNSQQLNMIAWMVADDEKIKTRDLDFALKAAKRGCELTEYKSASVLDTLARVYYEKGDLKSAVKWQAEALEHAEEGPMRDGIADSLKKYSAEAVSR